MSDCCRTWRACGLAWWVVRERTARIEGMWVVAGAARQLVYVVLSAAFGNDIKVVQYRCYAQTVRKQVVRIVPVVSCWVFENPKYIVVYSTCCLNA